MIQDAINALSGLQKQYNKSFSIEVMVDGSVILHYMEDNESDETFPKEFKNGQNMLDWMDNNLD